MDAVNKLRKPLLSIAIATLVIAAGMGIGVILAPDAFNEDSLRVLGTTASIGGYAVTLMCLVIGKHPLKAILFAVGSPSATAALLLVLAEIWGDSWADGEALLRALGVSVSVATYCALSNLLSSVTYRQPRVRWLQYTALALMAGVLLFVIAIILGAEPDSTSARAFGVLLILAVLAALVSLILAWAQGRADAVSDSMSDASDQLSAATWARIDQLRGTASRDDYVRNLLP